MRRVFSWIALVVVLAIALPPLFYAVTGEPQEDLPPADARYAVSGNVSVAAIERGRGPVAVLVHGLPGYSEDWGPTIDALAARGFRVIAYSRAGYGRSDRRKNDDYTPDGSAADLLGLLSGEDLRNVTVVGWSYGGATAIRAAIRDDERIGRLVLVGSAGPWADAPPDSPIISVLFSQPVLRWVAAVPPVAAAVRGALSREAFAGEPIPEWWDAQLAANFASPHTMDTFQREAARFRFDDSLDPAPVRRPILVIHGDQDRNVPLEVGRELAARARDAELVVVEGGGHMLPVTRPDLLAERIATFAARTGVRRR